MISIIVPIYKVESELRQCLDSIISQSYTDIEILLVDDGSPDTCGEICDEYAQRDDRIRVFHTENKGLSAARNLGLDNAKGDIVAFIDSDDWIEPDMIESLARVLSETNSDIAVSGYLLENNSWTQNSDVEGALYEGNASLSALLTKKLNNNVWNKIYRKELFQDVRFPEGKNYEDITVMHRVLHKAKRVAVISEPKYHYRVRSESITKVYTASNLIDYAEAQLTRYYYFKNEMQAFYNDNQEIILGYAAKGLSKVWRWWHGCTKAEKKEYESKIAEYQKFAKENFPRFGKKSWPKYLRISSFFMRSRSRWSFLFLYKLNQLYRKMKPKKANIVE